jgi:transposase
VSVNKNGSFGTCGVEVSAEWLHVSLDRGQQILPVKVFANTEAGHRALLRWLVRAGQLVRVCLEATGLYGLDVALALSEHPLLEVMVANPRAVRNFASAMMQRSKSDPLDAVVLREFAARMPFKVWTRPSRAALELHAMARRIAARVQAQTAEKNRWHATNISRTAPRAVRRDVADSLRAHRRAIVRLTEEAVALIATDEELAERFRWLLSVRGIGRTSAVQILAELALLGSDRDIRQWVAYAGLDPRRRDSGKSVHKKVRISKAGNRHLRRALFMPALVATRHEPHLRAFYQRLLARGKPKLVALIAVVRKLLHAIYGMFRHRQPFDGARLFSGLVRTENAPQEEPLRP